MGAGAVAKPKQAGGREREDAARSACCRAQVARTAASLLAAELGDAEAGARSQVPLHWLLCRHVGLAASGDAALSAALS
jgi:hypothetical protein